MGKSGYLTLWPLRGYKSIAYKKPIWNLLSPPLTLIYIGNGCEGYNTNIYIPNVQLKKTLCRLVPIHEQAAFKQQLAEIQTVAA